ncbi:hypothetical protein Vadar_001416 [Vaccinium darrowii]|uniref:Uncharacterized protein n=1 Tax=Vaccinium darrowii TaxID=229202 RepID=A0ACB7Y5E3_9ERIC|nr:hypothetical protein Vadar_001416 [Vaccinium darrowii]
MSGNGEIDTRSNPNEKEAKKIIQISPCGDDQKGKKMELEGIQDGAEDKEEENLDMDIFSIEGNYPSSSNPTESDDDTEDSLSIPPAKFCEFKMRVFLFETRLTPSDIEQGRLFIPVEMAIDHFPPLIPGFQIAYWERIRMTTPDKNAQNHRDWLMIVTYDPEECVFKINSVKWQKFAHHHNLKAMDSLRFYKPFPRAENNNFLIEHVSGDNEITSDPEFKRENFLFERKLDLYEVRSNGRPVTLAKKVVKEHFPAVRVPAETHKLERLYFTDSQNKEWCWKIYFSFGNYVIEGLEGFVNEYKVDVGDVVRFFKVDGNEPLESQRHFLIEHVRRREIDFGSSGGCPSANEGILCKWSGSKGGRRGKRKKKFGFGICFKA